MNKERPYTLLIMAAGMGSRFGGLKQIEPMGPNGEFLLDYSIYDAIQAGFKKVVFVIKEENYELFQETVGKRIEKQIQVEYAFQRITDIPKEYQLPKDRVKPLGTAQAILAAKDKIQEDFAVINADDFYGRDAFLYFVISFTRSKFFYRRVCDCRLSDSKYAYGKWCSKTWCLPSQRWLFRTHHRKFCRKERWYHYCRTTRW